MKTFRDLLIWQKAMALVTKCYSTSSNFPKEEQFGLTSQIRRCSISIPSNISEGYGRGTNKDYRRFLNISLGSLFEFQTQVEIAYNLEYLTEEKFNQLYEDSRELERMLTAFINKVNGTL
ncbi:four helix bundle protein [Flavobacterium sp. J49]|uniref:four helix bundle protein n=1 Tax=Flavobacterium sp. J49 TaxID=2718534 RepID=UPI0015930251|nr:four helix bundle protein [Flavobacterium sp. J49]MBF6639905.1 four helix bundle protein [Flavobacterium sp. J49]NIC01150.1 four helix bundle protein [Flavobacterium sp. J49]